MSDISVGVLGKVVGLKGLQRLYTNSDFVQYLKLPIKVTLKEDNSDDMILSLEMIKKHNNFFLLSFTELRQREQLKLLIGKHLYISSQDLPTLEDENEYYIDDLIDFQAISEDGKEIGWLLKEIKNYPANDVFIFSSGQKHFLIPFVQKHIGKIDVDKKTVEIINWKEWLEI